MSSILLRSQFPIYIHGSKGPFSIGFCDEVQVNFDSSNSTPLDSLARPHVSALHSSLGSAAEASASKMILFSHTGNN